MALLAKNSGMVINWPMPMKRSRDFTRQAMMSEKVAKIAEPSMTPNKTPSMAKGFQLNWMCSTSGDEVNDDGLHRSADTGRDRLAVDERGAMRGADQHLVNDAEVALPDDGDAVENGGEEHALRENARRHERQIADVAGGDAAHAAEDLAEDHQPQHGLHGARQHLGGIAQRSS